MTTDSIYICSFTFVQCCSLTLLQPVETGTGKRKQLPQRQIQSIAFCLFRGYLLYTKRRKCFFPTFVNFMLKDVNIFQGFWKTS